MNICLVGDASSPLSRQWAAPLVARGHTVTVVSYRRVTRPIDGAVTVDLTRLSNLPKVRFAIWGWWLRRALRRWRPDVLHARPITAAGWLAALASFHPFVVTAMGSDLLVEAGRGPFRRLLLRQVLARCDRLTAPTTTLIEAATSLGCPPAACHLVPWGIDTAVFQPGPADRGRTRERLRIPVDARLVLSPRGISPIYNHDTVVRACAAVRHEHPGLVLALLDFNADPACASELRRLADELGFADGLRWLPAAESPSAMAELYRAADVVASLPSTEGYGFSVLEAMACGCPTVISDVPAFRGDLEDGVHVLKVPVRDTAATAGALGAVLGDARLAERLRGNAVPLAAGRDLARHAELVEALYDEVVRLRKGR